MNQIRFPHQMLMFITCLTMMCSLNAMTSLVKKTTILVHNAYAKNYRHRAKIHSSTLYAPWRDSYSRAEGKHAASNKETTTSEQCSLCRLQHPEANDHIVFRGACNIVTLNQFPYNKGHIMVLPYEHTNSLDALCPHSRQEAMELITAGAKILKEELKADGINIGINLGKVAGAGIPSHLHWHLVPRWVGDTSYMTIVGNTTVLSTSLDSILQRLKPHFDKLHNTGK